MTGDGDDSPVAEKFCTELKTFFLALPTACTCSRSSVGKIRFKYSNDHLFMEIVPFKYAIVAII